MKDALIVSLLSVVPKNHTTRLMGAFSRLRLPRALHRLIVRWYVRHFQVNLDECVGGIDDFDTLAKFFIRPLKPGVRPIDPDPDALVCPVDGRAHTFGRIEGGRFVQADGQVGSIAGLLGEGDPRLPAAPGFDAARFEGGGFAVLYLSPKDYHRVHTPAEGRVVRFRYLPGRLWPVFPAATRRIEGLFDRNERLVFELDTPFGAIAYVMVGAFGVGRIATPLDPILSNQGAPAKDQPIDVALGRGDELARFEMGSTVILLTEPGRLDWTLEPGQVLRLGRPIARATKST